MRILFTLMVWAAVSICAAAEEVVTIPTRTGVTLAYLLTQEPRPSPKIVAISFVGGFGVVNLVKRSANKPPSFGPTANFAVRIRNLMADADIADVVVDVPSDQLPDGMSDDFRLGADHLADVRALIADLKKRFPNAKIYVLGHSRGTVSAASLGARLGADVQGVILLSTITLRDKYGPALSSFDFKTLRVPVLFVHHRNDACPQNPYANVARLAKSSSSFSLLSVSGGDPPQSGPCDSGSAHGFFGLDAAVVQDMKSWMLEHDFTHELP
jgi:hypothetical protein